MPSNTLSVTQLVRKMKTALQFEVGEVWVEGEISNFKAQKSGHRYFSIKDSGAQLPCALFRGRAKGEALKLKDGLQVKLFGEITIYEPTGRAQMIVSSVKIGGEGDLQAQFEALKQRLYQEGLFSEESKQALPKFPKRIGIITSPTGAALQDMINVFTRRAPWVELFLLGVQVQGKGAEHGIARAINYCNQAPQDRLPPLDVLIVGRGGGSLEDLWNFNEEVVARAIAASEIPVISAVGHEVDYTISDFVADYRAPTPSAAAEIAVRDINEILSVLRGCSTQLNSQLANHIQQLDERLRYLAGSLERKSPERIHEEREQLLGDLQERLTMAYEMNLRQKENALQEFKIRLAYHSPENAIDRSTDQLRQLRDTLESLVNHQVDQLESKLRSHKTLLRTLGPESTLARGYSITTNAEGEVVSHARDLSKGDRLVTTMQDGKVESTVD